MAVVGALGDIVFSVSQEQIKSLSNIKWESSAKYATHERHLREPVLEFTGAGVESFTFEIRLSAFLGVDPLKAYAELLTAERAGRAMTLVLGDHTYGTNQWVIEKLSAAMNYFDRAGNVLDLKANVTLKAYSAR